MPRWSSIRLIGRIVSVEMCVPAYWLSSLFHGALFHYELGWPQPGAEPRSWKGGRHSETATLRKRDFPARLIYAAAFLAANAERASSAE